MIPSLVLLTLLLPTATPAAPVPTPSASSTPLAATAPPAAPVPAVSATAIATLGPTAYSYRFVPHQPAELTPGQPQIFAVYLNDKHLRSHHPILIRVETNASVVKMESSNNGRGGAIPEALPGVFIASGMIPAIPFIARGMTTEIIFTGTSADGRTVRVRVPVVIG